MLAGLKSIAVLRWKGLQVPVPFVAIEAGGEVQGLQSVGKKNLEQHFWPVFHLQQFAPKTINAKVCGFQNRNVLLENARVGILFRTKISRSAGGLKWKATIAAGASLPGLPAKGRKGKVHFCLSQHLRFPPYITLIIGVFMNRRLRLAEERFVMENEERNQWNPPEAMSPVSPTTAHFWHLCWAAQTTKRRPLVPSQQTICLVVPSY